MDLQHGQLGCLIFQGSHLLLLHDPSREAHFIHVAVKVRKLAYNIGSRPLGEALLGKGQKDQHAGRAHAHL